MLKKSGKKNVGAVVKLGSLFSGIGGFELGLERSIPGLKTIWQVENNKFCRKILKKHWPNSILFDDVKTVGKHNLPVPDMLCAGWPCQDLSVAGYQGGIYAKRSGLWWESFRIIGELRPRIVVLENVANLFSLGIREVLGSLASIGYDSEWTIIPAGGPGGVGAPHLRKRVFIVSYTMQGEILQQQESDGGGNSSSISSRHGAGKGASYWETNNAPSLICGVDHGIPNRLERCKVLGNSIVPQCSEWIGKQILKSGLLKGVISC